MMSDVVNVVANVITQVFSLSLNVFRGLGALDLIFGAFSVYTIYRFLLSPLFGRSAVSNLDVVTSKVYSGRDSKSDANNNTSKGESK